jgi:signal transduction histidine kinase
LEPVDLVKLLQKQKDDYFYVARKKSIALKATLLSGELLCYCDSVKISQVISNFIDNAIKYSNTGTTIEIIGEKQAPNVWIGVKDEGPGIKTEELQHLFKSFGHNKISSRPTAGEKSSGLGLAISKKIIEAHRGQIGVDSMPGQGSTFWFSLPTDV